MALADQLIPIPEWIMDQDDTEEYYFVSEPISPAKSDIRQQPSSAVENIPPTPPVNVFSSSDDRVFGTNTTKCIIMHKSA